MILSQDSLHTKLWCQSFFGSHFKISKFSHASTAKFYCKIRIFSIFQRPWVCHLVVCGSMRPKKADSLFLKSRGIEDTKYDTERDLLLGNYGDYLGSTPITPLVPLGALVPRIVPTLIHLKRVMRYVKHLWSAVLHASLISFWNFLNHNNTLIQLWIQS